MIFQSDFFQHFKMWDDVNCPRGDLLLIFDSLVESNYVSYDVGRHCIKKFKSFTF